MPSSMKLFSWARDLHLYLGLFVSPFVLVFALSVIFLNHTWLPWGGAQEGVDRSRVTVSIPEGEEDALGLATNIREQLGRTGEIGFIQLDLANDRLAFPMERPGERTMVRVDLTSSVADLERRQTGVWDAMIYLHKMPGPHNVNIRGNWIFTRVWALLANLTIYLLLFVTATGVLLWAALRAERRVGLILLGSGALSFATIVLSLTI